MKNTLNKIDNILLELNKYKIIYPRVTTEDCIKIVSVIKDTILSEITHDTKEIEIDAILSRTNRLYSVAILKNGNKFRINRSSDYGEDYPKDKCVIVHPDKGAANKLDYFDAHGYLNEKYMSLEFLHPIKK